tara:strand:+ start:316 stop:900 length:585 start_codon:yes stop_codon:yes gene_type:complete
MIFSNSKSEIYWILSKLMKQFDIVIFKKIMNEKRKLEDKEISEWYIEQGLRLSKLRIKDHKKLYIDKILFNPYGGNYHALKNHHIRVFHYKIIFETFSHEGFILNYENDEYSIPSLSEKIQTLNDYIRNHGIYEIYGKTFQYKSFKLTDLVGNPCVRSIIRNKINNDIIYEYKTMAISGDQFIDPVERLPRGIH